MDLKNLGDLANGHRNIVLHWHQDDLNTDLIYHYDDSSLYQQ